MEVLVLVLIILGAVIMVGNIAMYGVFIYRMNDVISSGRKKDSFLVFLGLVLLIFFLIGYIVVGFWSKGDLMVAFILFFGAVFVTVMLLLYSTLISTAKDRSMQIAQVLIDVVDARDPNLHGHSRHVKNLTMMFYKYLPTAMKININQVSLEYASLMHDIGKLGIPESILNKPAKLTDEEWEIMKTHPKVGVKLLKQIRTFDSISDWILYHHERPDGKGYYKKNPVLVPLAAKMISVCDTYSAITMKRSYKSSRTHEEAIQIIKEVAGTQLDKTLVDIFVTIPKEEFEKCIPDKVEN